ncbi:MAG: protein kinase [Gammaproteobacteria bacterium]|nr:protein kinase [Gammaproteobacteria bacterium]
MTTKFRNALGQGIRVDRYEIESAIGLGGFGITYRAMDIQSGERVALKEYLPPDLAVREAGASVYPLSESHAETFRWGLERFLDEVHLLERFNHPNIVRVHRAFEDNGTAYMVMDCEEGESLAECLRRESTLESEPLTDMTMRLLDGLELVHEEGYIHRDIKPSNILLRRDGTPVLLDFGSARMALRGKTRTLTALVSAGYAPLEQYFSRSDLQGPWTDIYALGATLYHAVSAEAPMDAVERSRGVLGSTRDLLVPAAELGCGRYAPHFLCAIDHALSMEWEERPESVATWRAELSGEVPVPGPAATVRAPPDTGASTFTLRQDGPTGRRPFASVGVRLVLGVALVLGIGTLGWRPWGTTTVDRVHEPVDELAATGDGPPAPAPSGELIANLRGALEEANGETERVRQRAEALAERLRALEGAAGGEQNSPRAAEQATLIANLRDQLEKAAGETERVRQEAEALAEQLRALEGAGDREHPDTAAEIAVLLAAAAEDVDAWRLTKPAGNNAYQRYLRVLELEAGNADALHGLRVIADKYLYLAGRALEDGERGQAEAYLERAAGVVPEYEPVRAARERLATKSGAPDEPEPEAGSGPATSTSSSDATSQPRDDDAPGEEGAPAAIQRVARGDPQAGKAKGSQDPWLWLAVLPFASSSNAGSGENSTAAWELDQFVRRELWNPDLKVVGAYSAGDSSPDGIWDPDSLWQGGPLDRQPVDARIYALAEVLKTDAALMYFHGPRTSDRYASDRFRVKIYLFDLVHRRRYAGEGDERTFKDATNRLIAELVEARAGAASNSIVAPRARVDSSVEPRPLRVGIFPMATSRPHSRQHVELEAAVVRELRRYVFAEGRLELVYSYELGRSDWRATRFAGLWIGGVSRKQPDMRVIERAASTLDVDVVLTAWLNARGAISGEWQDYLVELYLLDARGGHEYREIGVAMNMPQMLPAVFSRLEEPSHAPGPRRIASP